MEFRMLSEIAEAVTNGVLSLGDAVQFTAALADGAWHEIVAIFNKIVKVAHGR